MLDKTRLHGGSGPRQKHERRHLTEAVMGPLGVVGLEPGLGELPHLVEGVEEIRVEDFFPNAAIEPLDEGVLIRVPGLDVADGDALRTTRRRPRR